jgi:hypothetical protein
MSVIRGVIGSQNYEAGIKKLDIRDTIFQLQPDVAPFITLLQKIPKLRAVDTEVKWFEDDLLGNWTQVNGAVASTTQTFFVVDDESIFQENDIIKNVTTGELMRITAIDPTTHTLSVVRAWGVHIAVNLGNNDYIYKLGSAQMEGWTSPESLVTAKTPLSNYLQIFSKTVMITETADNIDVYGGNRRDFERKKKGIELKREIESQFLFGEKKEDATGSQKRWQTGGVYYFIKGTAPELDMNSAALTESAWESFLKDLFAYGSSERWFFCGTLILSQISQFASGKQRLEPGKTLTYGVKVNKYHSANGDVNLIRDEHFVGPFAGMGIALEMDELFYRFLQNSDIQLKLNLQNKKDHYILDEYFGQIGLEIHHAKKHGIVFGVA